MNVRRVCVFCGSSAGSRQSYGDAAVELGRALVDRGLGLVYGGASVGLMGLLADEVLRGGGEVIGVIPRALFSREVGHTGLTELHEVGSMHERKALMYDLADGFVALPGGVGTLDELAEMVTWGQLGLLPKPAALVSVDGYWRPLLDLLDRMADEGFLRPRHRTLIRHFDDIGEALDSLADYTPVTADKWIEADDR